MKLRNKKTGEIIETEENYFYMTFSDEVRPKDGFTSIRNFNEICEDLYELYMEMYNNNIFNEEKDDKEKATA